jgi:hypothetical protein
MAPRKMVLVQEHVTATTARKLDALARAVGCSRNKYVSRLLTAHVKCVKPRLVSALDKTRTDPVLG